MNISLTYDYELFLGQKSGTPINSLLRPTELLLKNFRRLGIKATFFVDVTYYRRLIDNPSTQSDALLIKRQLQEIIEQGSRIELHLHPQWLDAKYISGGEWGFPTYKHYRLQSLPQSKITELFIEGTQTLEEIAHEVKPGYKVIAFRAGGWCVQPFDPLKEGFVKAGIRIDSSVAQGFSEESSVRSFDFRNAPKSALYKFNDDPMLEVSGGSFIEVPITSYSVSFFEKLRNKLLKKRIAKSMLTPIYGDGLALPAKASWHDKFKSSIKLVSLDSTNSNEIISSISGLQYELVNIISHPKVLSLMSIESLEKIQLLGAECITLYDLLSRK